MAKSVSAAAASFFNSNALLAAFSSAYGGNTARMASALGVTRRTVQRYYTTAKEQRKPSPSVRAEMARQVPIQGHIKGKFFFDTPGFRERPDTRERDITFQIKPEEMGDIIDAVQAGDGERAEELFFEAYGMAAPDEVIGAEYSFSIGEEP